MDKQAVSDVFEDFFEVSYEKCRKGIEEKLIGLKNSQLVMYTKIEYSNCGEESYRIGIETENDIVYLSERFTEEDLPGLYANLYNNFSLEGFCLVDDFENLRGFQKDYIESMPFDKWNEYQILEDINQEFQLAAQEMRENMEY